MIGAVDRQNGNFNQVPSKSGRVYAYEYESTREHTCVCVCVGGCHSKAPSFHLVPVNVTKDPWENHALGLRSQSPTQLVFCALTEPPSSLNALAFIWPQHYLH